MDIEASGADVMVSPVDACRPRKVAVTDIVPALPVVVKEPPCAMLATVASDVDHCTCEVTSGPSIPVEVKNTS